MIQHSHLCVYSYISKGKEIMILRKYFYSHVHDSIINNSQGMETP